MLQKLTELIARPDEQIGIAIHVDDKINRFEENGILGIRMLHLFRLWWFLRFV